MGSFLRCIANTSDEDQCLAMLAQPPIAGVMDLLQRLDAAIDDACEKGNFIDDINAPLDFRSPANSRNHATWFMANVLAEMRQWKSV